jgi:enoyl-CoA hydratase/carnithine racemase
VYRNQHIKPEERKYLSNKKRFNMHDYQSPSILVSAQGPIIEWSLNRPTNYNALSWEVLGQLADLCQTAKQSLESKVILISAQGKGFCAGHDLSEISKMTAHEQNNLLELCSNVMQMLQHLPQIVIASVHGTATAAGLQLVTSCDLVIAEEHARFAASGIHYGLFCATPCVPLSRRIAKTHSFEMLFTGDSISAQRAYEIGLINEVVPHDSLMERTWQLAKRIARHPEDTLSAGKALFYEQLDCSLQTAYPIASTEMQRQFDSEIGRSGIASFLEKKLPPWK